MMLDNPTSTLESAFALIQDAIKEDAEYLAQRIAGCILSNRQADVAIILGRIEHLKSISSVCHQLWRDHATWIDRAVEQEERRERGELISGEQTLTVPPLLDVPPSSTGPKRITPLKAKNGQPKTATSTEPELPLPPIPNELGASVPPIPTEPLAERALQRSQKSPHPKSELVTSQEVHDALATNRYGPPHMDPAQRQQLLARTEAHRTPREKPELVEVVLELLYIAGGMSPSAVGRELLKRHPHVAWDENTQIKLYQQLRKRGFIEGIANKWNITVAGRNHLGIKM